MQLQCYDTFYVVSHSARTQVNNGVLAFNPTVNQTVVCDHFNVTTIEGYLCTVNVLIKCGLFRLRVIPPLLRPLCVTRKKIARKNVRASGPQDFTRPLF